VAAERSWRQAARDAAPVALVLALCPLVAAIAPGPAVPVERAADLIAVERSLGLFFEPAVHAWFAARPRLMGAADFGYAAIHLPVLLGVLAWVWTARPTAFRRVRNTFVATQVLLVAGYALVPTAPPRMVASLQYGSAGTGLTGLDRLAMSPYAAMPSGHAAFSLLVAGIVVALSRRRLVQAIAVLYPVAVGVEIVGTGNHIWLDAIAGAAAAAVGFAVVSAIEHRWRVQRPARRSELVGDGSAG
jgi:hypothetical protein